MYYEVSSLVAASLREPGGGGGSTGRTASRVVLTPVQCACLKLCTPACIVRLPCCCLFAFCLPGPPPQVFLADPFQSFTSQGDWGSRLMSPDGLHLSKAGNDEVWNIFYNAINDKMQLT